MKASGEGRSTAAPGHRDGQFEPDGEASPTPAEAASAEAAPDESRRPDVTVVVTTFNRFDLLSRALASVVAQVGVDLEIIVVDDASADGTPDRLEALGHPRVRVVRQPSNQGVARARNRALAEARAPWVAFLDDDDFWAPRRLQRLLEVAEADSAAWVYGSFWWTDAEGEPLWAVPARDPADLAVELFDDNIVGTPSTVMARTELLRAAGGFDERLQVLADWDLWLRLQRLGRAAACPDPLVAYVEHDGNMQLTQSLDIPKELRYISIKHRAAAREARAHIGGRIYRRWLARTHLRAGKRLRAAAGYVRVGLVYRQRRDLVTGAGVLVGTRGTRLVRRLAGRPAAPVRAPRPAPEPWLQDGFRARLGGS